MKEKPSRVTVALRIAVGLFVAYVFVTGVWGLLTE
jgi:hypothetical protein